jgi:hypothetical protein
LTIVEYELNEIVDKKLKKAQKEAATAAIANPDLPEEVYIRNFVLQYIYLC